MERWCIDRFEGDWAVLENEQAQHRTLPLSQLPAGLKEGDWLWENGGVWQWDKDHTAETAERIAKKLKTLWK